MKRGDKIRLNEQNAQTETVLNFDGLMVTTYEGGHYHHTKVVRV